MNSNYKLPYNLKTTSNYSLTQPGAADFPGPDFKSNNRNAWFLVSKSVQFSETLPFASPKVEKPIG